MKRTCVNDNINALSLENERKGREKTHEELVKSVIIRRERSREPSGCYNTECPF